MTDIQKIAEERYPYMNDGSGYASRYNATQEDLRAAFISGYQYGREWMSVKEDLPSEGTRILCYGVGGRMVCAQFINGRFMCYDIFSEELEECEDITHWMPLPSPPTT